MIELGRVGDEVAFRLENGPQVSCALQHKRGCNSAIYDRELSIPVVYSAERWIVLDSKASSESASTIHVKGSAYEVARAVHREEMNR